MAVGKKPDDDLKGPLKKGHKQGGWGPGKKEIAQTRRKNKTIEKTKTEGRKSICEAKKQNILKPITAETGREMKINPSGGGREKEGRVEEFAGLKRNMKKSEKSEEPPENGDNKAVGAKEKNNTKKKIAIKKEAKPVNGVRKTAALAGGTERKK